MKIYLIRHGTTDSNYNGQFQGSTDNELNQMGMKQANCLGEKFKQIDLDAIYSSPLRRAKQTAEGVLTHHPKLKLNLVEDLREIDGGLLEGNSSAYNHEHYGEVLELLKTKPGLAVCPNGEACVQVYERMGKAIDAIANKHRNDQAVAVVSHGCAIMAYLSYAKGIKAEEMERNIPHNASVTTIEYIFTANDRQIRIEEEDNNEHLPSELRFLLHHMESAKHEQ